MATRRGLPLHARACLVSWRCACIPTLRLRLSAMSAGESEERCEAKFWWGGVGGTVCEDTDIDHHSESDNDCQSDANSYTDSNNDGEDEGDCCTSDSDSESHDEGGSTGYSVREGELRHARAHQRWGIGECTGD